MYWRALFRCGSRMISVGMCQLRTPQLILDWFTAVFVCECIVSPSRGKCWSLIQTHSPN